MKSKLILLAISVFVGMPNAVFASEPVITLNASSTVSSDYIMLGNIATISPSPLTDKDSAKLAATIVGRAPLPGLNRPLNRGDVRLKLRANGIDPTNIDIEGPINITVTSAGAGTQNGTSGQPGTATQPATNPNVIKFGDAIDILVIDGPVIVHARGYASQSGAVGDSIQVRRDGLDHLLTCTVIGAGQDSA